MGKKEVKTNAMRILDRKKISYEYQTYECDEFTDGIETADKLNLPHEQVYKTIVTTGKSGEHYVFVLPIEAEIDFKKAAKAVGEKSIEMLHLKELTPLTGYVRGGCTSIGMKKHFPTVIDASAQQLESLCKCRKNRCTTDTCTGGFEKSSGCYICRCNSCIESFQKKKFY